MVQWLRAPDAKPNKLSSIPQPWNPHGGNRAKTPVGCIVTAPSPHGRVLSVLQKMEN